MTRIKCLLWDFGNTLCDEMFIWGSGPEWRRAWDTIEGRVFDEWSLGNLDTQAFADILSEVVGLSPADVVAFMTARCKQVSFFPLTYQFFCARKLPQAIVTVNPDLFSDVIEPTYRFRDFTSAIVTSWEERTLDKGELCATALKRMNVECDPSEALLIDNRLDCIEDWSKIGGAGYHYRGEEKFMADVDGGIDRLVHAL